MKLFLINLFDSLMEKLILLGMDNVDWKKGGKD